MLNIGAHNLWDGKGDATPFAKVLLFTESIPAKIRAELGGAYDIFVSKRQPDLVIAVKKGHWKHEKQRYRLAHIGISKITPHRGTFMIQGRLDGKRTRIFVEHRINSSFKPWRNGERWLRRRFWKRHTNMSLRWIKRSKKKNFRVIAGGDLNTPRWVKGYRGFLREVGRGLDRIGASFPMKNFRVFSREGSDHPRVYVEEA